MMGRWIRYIFTGLVLASLSCSNLLLGSDNHVSYSSGVLVAVDSLSYPALLPELARYLADLEEQGFRGEILIFNGVSAEELKSRVWAGGYASDMVFLVGNLPWADYETEAFGYQETFPVDLYFASDEVSWTDTDGNGVFDAHSPIRITKPVSRIKGTASELKFYFDKLHEYAGASFPDVSEAFLFKDDDWQDYKRGSSLGLDRLYSRIVTKDTAADTLMLSYTDKLASGFSMYVYQWIHASPDTLFFKAPEGYEIFSIGEIERVLPQGAFYNLFDCKAAKFTQPNLGMQYLTHTPYGLAVQGSTKIGGNYYPMEFHRSLAGGNTWSQAFADWYNLYGVLSDEWFLGMCVFGCPALRPVAASRNRNPWVGSARELIPAAFNPETQLFRDLVRVTEELGN